MFTCGSKDLTADSAEESNSDSLDATFALDAFHTEARSRKMPMILSVRGGSICIQCRHSACQMNISSSILQERHAISGGGIYRSSGMSVLCILGSTVRPLLKYETRNLMKSS